MSENVYSEENDEFSVRSLSKEAQHIVMVQLFSMVKEMPYDDSMLEKKTSQEEKEKFISDTESRRQYRDGYIYGWKKSLERSDVESLKEILWSGNMKARKLKNGAIEILPISLPRVRHSGEDNVIFTSNAFHHTKGVSDGHDNMRKLIDQAQKKTIAAATRWSESNLQRLLSEKKLDESEKQQRIKSVPELEALIYLHKNIFGAVVQNCADPTDVRESKNDEPKAETGENGAISQ